jgi:hypothetical protein
LEVTLDRIRPLLYCRGPPPRRKTDPQMDLPATIIHKLAPSHLWSQVPPIVNTTKRRIKITSLKNHYS